MRSKHATTLVLAMLVTCALAIPAHAGALIRYIYGGDGLNDIPGTETAALKSSVNYLAGRFSSSETLTEKIESSQASGTLANYGAEIKGWLEAPQTGSNYYFWISSADSSELWLSTDVTPAKASLIASVSGRTASREYTKYASQKSGPISLVKGNKYYFQILQKTGGSANGHVSIGWQLPDATIQRPIPAAYAQNYTNAPTAPKVTLPMAATNNVDEGAIIQLSVGVDASQPATYQWFTRATPASGNPVLLSGEILSSLTRKVKLSDNGKEFGVTVSNPLGSTNIVTILNVTPDTTPPTLLSVSPRGNPYKVTVVFSEDVDPATATNIVNYSIRDGTTTAIGISAARMATANTVELTTSLVQGNLYVLTINNVRDTAALPNPIAQNSSATFILTDGAVQVRLFNAASTNTLGTVGDITNNLALLSGSADRTFFNTSFETPSWDNGSNYLGQVRGYVTAPRSGEYVFGISSSDSSLLYLSTDENAANRILVATVNDTSTAQREFTKTTEQISSAVSLIGGRRYYLEALFMKNGSGGGVSVAWQMPGGENIGNNTPAIPDGFISAVKKSGNVKITNQPPATVTAIEGGSAILSIGNDGVDGSPLYYYQWMKNGKAIDGATSSSYATPAITAADNGAVFTLTVSNAFSSTVSSTCVLQVDADVTPPSVSGVGCIKTPFISVGFSEIVGSASATNTTNYVLKTASGVTVPVTNATLSARGDAVTLTAASLNAGESYSLTISGIKDASARANLMTAATIVFVPMDLTVLNIDNSQDYSVGLSGNKLEILAGGAGTSGSADQFVYAFMAVTNDFDFRMKVQSLPSTASGAMCGLMARESVAPGSRFLFNAVAAKNGKTVYWPQWREGTDDAVASDAGTHPSAALPNAWVRLVRDGGVFNHYTSIDGANWSLIKKIDSSTSIYGPLPDVILIGVATTSQSVSGTINAVASNFEAVAEQPARIVAQPPAALTTFTYHPLVIQVGAEGSHLKFQWRKNGIDIPDAVSSAYTVDQAVLDDSGTYSVRVYNRINEVISSNCVVTVEKDVAPPVIYNAKGSMSLDRVTVTFNERVDATNSIAIENYQITPDLVVLGAVLEYATNVVLTTSPHTPGAAYTVTVSNVTDLAQNTIAAGASRKFNAYNLASGFAVMELFYDVPLNLTLNDFVATEKFSDNKPDALAARPNFSSPWNETSEYAGRLSAVVTAPETGEYTFYISSDSQSVLYVSTDEHPVDWTLNVPSAQVSAVTGWTAEAQWDKNEEQASAPIALVQGQKYHVFALWKPGEGPGDGCSVGWKRPANTNRIEVIPGEFLSSYIDLAATSVTISQQPTNTTVLAGSTATFTIGAYATWDLGPAVNYQWQLNQTNIAGATNASFTTAPLSLSDSGGKYRCIVSIPVKSAVSDEAVLTVQSSTGVVPKFDGIVRKGSSITITWTGGILQSADAVTGVYTDVPGAASPYVVPATDSRKFYRLRGTGVAAQPKIETISRTGQTVTVTWSGGVLQAADAVNGAYTDVTGAVSPYSAAATSTRRFFRVRSN